MSQNELKKRLSPRQLETIPIILATASISEAVKQSKVARITIRRWLEQPLFKKTIEEKRQELFEAGLNRLKASTDKASLVMIALLESKDENVRRLTAKDILNFALKALETQDLVDRIEKIEEILESRLVS